MILDKILVLNVLSRLEPEPLTAASAAARADRDQRPLPLLANHSLSPCGSALWPPWARLQPPLAADGVVAKVVEVAGVEVEVPVVVAGCSARDDLEPLVASAPEPGLYVAHTTARRL